MVYFCFLKAQNIINNAKGIPQTIKNNKTYPEGVLIFIIFALHILPMDNMFRFPIIPDNDRELRFY